VISYPVSIERVEAVERLQAGAETVPVFVEDARVVIDV
jgi:hypothetical protein